jgi:hypothetical protein
MPILDAKFLETDPDGADLLRSVMATGRRGRRRKIAGFVGLRAEKRLTPARPIRVEVEDEDAELHPAMLAAIAE